MGEEKKSVLEVDAQSVQTHLGIMQNIIQRMAANSSSCKTWCITIVSAVLVIVAEKGNSNFVFIALIPALLFLLLDAYYLSLERAFRDAYNQFVRRLHADQVTTKDLYLVAPPAGNNFRRVATAIKSFSVYSFYLVMIISIIMTWFLVKK